MNNVTRYVFIEGQVCAEPVAPKWEFATRYVVAGAYSALEAECERLKHSQQVLMQSRNAHRDERDKLRQERDALAAELAAIKAQEPAHWWVDGVEYCQKPFTNDWHPHHALPPVAGQVKS